MLTVKAELMSILNFLVGGVVVAWERNYSLQCFWESMCLFMILVPTTRSFYPLSFQSRSLAKFALYGRFLFPSYFESSSLKGWVIYCLIKSSRCCCWYPAFLLNPLKFDGIASSHSASPHIMCIIS
jgi:hypothetical protein